MTFAELPIGSRFIWKAHANAALPRIITKLDDNTTDGGCVCDPTCEVIIVEDEVRT